ncbi:TPA: hypothetical protein DCZ16_00375 [Candidatus Peregrinibacteria bacterium]|nr:hypothetical protein [Candidatus Peregrinibacteria bacterium]
MFFIVSIADIIHISVKQRKIRIFVPSKDAVDFPCEEITARARLSLFLLCKKPCPRQPPRRFFCTKNL